jgi:hypothetical protein
MVFSYGLPDEETIAARLAGASAHPMAVHTVALPGFDPFRSWHLFRRATDPDEHWDVVVFAVYQWRARDFAALPPDDEVLPAPALPEELFRFVDGVVIKPNGKPIQTVLGSTYYGSFLGFGLFSLADDVLMQLGVRAARRTERVEGHLDGAARFGALVGTLRCWLGARKAQLLVAFVPDIDFPHGYYDELRAAVPHGVPVLDLQSTLVNELRGHRAIAAGHFGSEQAQLVGSRIAREVDRLVVGASLAPPAAPAGCGASP